MSRGSLRFANPRVAARSLVEYLSAGHRYWWVVMFIRMDPNAKWGQVVGNVVSEWTQIFGLVLLTKRMIERHSKESNR